MAARFANERPRLCLELSRDTSPSTPTSFACALLPACTSLHMLYNASSQGSLPLVKSRPNRLDVEKLK
ncbi:unnamed protein product [Periconia digitata]|uniref:Uncharacterized protein n=1 Tax=Periconia digitata TaxID=1303443 RepID=A0A9W4XXB2_9PLEO|nr:unnamed protein product [Periconia digitata]